MKPIVAIKTALNLLIIIFLIKGILSELGIGARFDSNQIYGFAYIGFGMAALAFFDRFLVESEDDE